MVVRIGNQLQGLFWRAGSSYGERVEWRIQRWRWRRLGWPELPAATSFAAAGARVGAGLALRLANKLAATLALLHGSLRVQRTHARGHLVTGASPTTSPCGGAFRLRWRERPGGELVNEAWGKRCSGSVLLVLLARQGRHGVR